MISESFLFQHNMLNVHIPLYQNIKYLFMNKNQVIILYCQYFFQYHNHLFQLYHYLFL